VQCLRVERQSETVGQPSQVVEHPDDVRDLETSVVIESQSSKSLPVALDHSGGRRAQLVSDLAESAAAFIELRDIPPSPTLDRLDELGLGTLDTQKLCVRLSSVEAILGGRRYPGNEFTLASRERARAEHDSAQELDEGRPDPGVRHDQPPHTQASLSIVTPLIPRSSSPF
jgi:hypothetical protein